MFYCNQVSHNLEIIFDLSIIVVTNLSATALKRVISYYLKVIKFVHTYILVKWKSYFFEIYELRRHGLVIKGII